MAKIIFIILIAIFSVNLCLAASVSPLNPENNLEINKQVGGLAGEAGFAPSGVEVTNIVGNFITGFLSLLGIIFIILMIYGGYNWMTASGDEKKVDKAKDTITRAIIGLIIAVGAYAISQFVMDRLLR